MKITWVTRSFLDYRIPVYKYLDKLCGHQLTVIYNGDVVPRRCQDKLKEILGDRAVPLRGEFRIGNRFQLGVANKGIRIPIQRGLIKAIKSSHPNILISDGFFQWTYAPLWLRMRKWRDIKHVMCYEKTKHTERNAPKWRIWYRKMVSRWIDGIDCNGILTKEYVHDKLGYNKSVTFGHMVADTEGMALNVEKSDVGSVDRIREELTLSGLTFIYVGRLVPLKGIIQLLEGWVKADLTNATLLLVGDGSQREEIENYIRDNNISNVKLAGSVNYDDLGTYYKAADCFIIPTLEDNWSLVVPEAMAAGLPIACSIYNGCHPELVHADNGWIFDPLNVPQTTETLRTISNNRDSLQRMGEESRKIVANYTPKHAAQALYDMCVKLIRE